MDDVHRYSLAGLAKLAPQLDPRYAKYRLVHDDRAMLTYLECEGWKKAAEEGVRYLYLDRTAEALAWHAIMWGLLPHVDPRKPLRARGVGLATIAACLTDLNRRLSPKERAEWRKLYTVREKAQRHNATLGDVRLQCRVMWGDAADASDRASQRLPGIEPKLVALGVPSFVLAQWLEAGAALQAALPPPVPVPAPPRPRS